MRRTIIAGLESLICRVVSALPERVLRRRKYLRPPFPPLLLKVIIQCVSRTETLIIEKQNLVMNKAGF